MLRVKAERLRRNWTQTDLGYHARITPAEISRIETGRLRPYPGQAERLARVLDIMRPIYSLRWPRAFRPWRHAGERSSGQSPLC